jgi:hypothetical protein
MGATRRPIVTWSLVTEPDELERCCVVVDGVRCGQRTAWRVSGEAWDDYTYVCGDHVELVLEAGHTAERVEPVPTVISRG